MWLIMPLMHSENVDDINECTAQFEEMHLIGQKLDPPVTMQQ